MKILLVDSNISGHHHPYLEALASLNCSEMEIVALLPAKCNLPCEVMILSRKYDLIRRSEYKEWLDEITNVALAIGASTVHFLYADALYRHFGIGLKRISGKVIGTFHQFRYSMLHRWSLKYIFKQTDVVVVHTEMLLNFAKTIGRGRFEQVDYPVFENLAIDESPDQSKMRWNVDDTKPVMLCLGGTRKDKGLDIALKALQEVEEPFWLIIAGVEQDITRNDIVGLSSMYTESVRTHLRFLEESEIASVLNAADIVLLPYRRVFDGASGPLGLGVRMGKQIVGPDHGSLGSIIAENHLGQTFCSEDNHSLANAINRALVESDFEPDNSYEAYQRILDPELFRDKYRSIYESLM